MYKGDQLLKAINAECKALLTPEARLRFLEVHSGLPSDWVSHIDSIGSPWPGTLEREAREATEAGMEFSRYINALSPLIDIHTASLENKVAAFESATKQGETPDPIPEFGDLREYIIHVAQSSEEDIETVDIVFEAVLAYYRCIWELVNQAIERRKVLESRPS